MPDVADQKPWEMYASQKPWELYGQKQPESIDQEDAVLEPPAPPPAPEPTFSQWSSAAGKSEGDTFKSAVAAIPGALEKAGQPP